MYFDVEVCASSCESDGNWIYHRRINTYSENASNIYYLGATGLDQFESVGFTQGVINLAE